MTNCPNCGAPVTAPQCEYCGSIVNPRIEPSGKELWARWDRLQHAEVLENCCARIDWVQQMQQQQLMEAAVRFPGPSFRRISAEQAGISF